MQPITLGGGRGGGRPRSARRLPRVVHAAAVTGAPRSYRPAPAVIENGLYVTYDLTTAVALTRDMANPLVYDDEAVRGSLVRKLAEMIV